MTNVLEKEAAVQSTVKDRRRPGRSEQVSPELIPLLRGEAPIVPDQPTQFGDPDQLRGARGLALALGASAVLWAAIAAAARWTLS